MFSAIVFRRAALPVFASLLFACGGDTPDAGADGAMADQSAGLVDDATPRVDRVRSLLTTLAHDSMEGRASGTVGAERARRFLTAELERYGVEPAGTEGYSQPLTLVRIAGPQGRMRWGPMPETATAADYLPENQLQIANVLGMIPGSDPALTDEIIVVGAHFDHLGIGTAVDGDSIFNGADDDASGTIAALEIARAFAQARARGEGSGRSVLIALFTAEEMGLVGTRMWLEDPTVPMDRIVADLQIEMIGRPDSLSGGFGRGWLTGYERSTMGDILAAQGSPIVPDPRPEMRFYFRSDNLPFAQLGIPAHTLSSYNMHTDYHTVADEVDQVDFAHMTALIDAAEAMMWELTSGPTPEWKEGGRPEVGG